VLFFRCMQLAGLPTGNDIPVTVWEFLTRGADYATPLPLGRGVGLKSQSCTESGSTQQRASMQRRLCVCVCVVHALAAKSWMQ
jgi:hypothetical protein